MSSRKDQNRCGLPPAARIVTSVKGGPIRTIINGRRNLPTGRRPCLKGQGRALPWEGLKVERPVIVFCDVASPVVSISSQPHRLELNVAGDPQEWQYFPDLEITAEVSFVESVCAGTPFAQAAIDWVPSRTPERTTTLIMELKSDRDRRMADRRYLQKLELVREAYSRAGLAFTLLTFSRDFGCVDMRPFRYIAYYRGACVDVIDTYSVVDLLERSGGISTFGALCNALGGGPAAKAKLAMLHLRRVISIDLSHGVGDASEARLICPIETRR